MKVCMTLMLFFGAASLMDSSNGLDTIDYGSLIKNIYDTYGTAGIIIASSVNYQSFSRLTVWQRVTRMLSEKKIATGLVNFEQFKDRLEFYTSRTVRPLVVILFGKMEAINRFSRLAVAIDMSYPVWVFLFTAETNSDVCKFCHAPHQNLLNLRFNSEALILCCNSLIIDEWWSKTENHTNTRELGKWNDERNEIEWFTENALYSRRSSVEGRKFRVAIVKGSGYIWQKNAEVFGFLGGLLKELSRSMNFTISSIITTIGYGSWNPETSKWSGVIGSLRRNEADMAISEFSMTHKRLDMVDFTIPIAVGYARIYIQKPNGAHVKWNAYFKAFATDVWVVIIGLLVTMPLFLTLIKYKRRKFSLFPLVVEHYSYVWGIYCQQALAEFPAETPLRIVYLSIFISSLVVSAAYAASLISFLAVSSSYLPFNTVEQFAADGTYKLVVLKDSSDYDTLRTSNETIANKLMSLMKPYYQLPQTLEEGFQQVCNGRVAFITNEAMKDAVLAPMPCEIASIKTGRIETLGMIMPLRSEYTALVNFHIQRFKDNGILERLKQEYFRQEDSPELSHPPVDQWEIAPILCVLTGGFFIALVIFLMEHIFHYLRNKFRNYKIKKFSCRKDRHVHFAREAVIP
ncbi:glutamate receptor 1 [Diachasma alloeum]|uniref:Ionotropic receptor 114 n=1 Tax=Diachasma alloeum TaxID=454923 RepID=A0A4E0S4G6_9HYME|nr:glutamate receptor 1 [Diachasma alloeum]THK33013.1 ionotropic receptor 114 [Diachasma alloeum]